MISHDGVVQPRRAVLASRPDAEDVRLRVHPDNERGQRLYRSRGFLPNGEVHDGELVRWLSLKRTYPTVVVPRLILLNGPPGCGKSTLARRYVDEHPLALNLDVDGIRGLIGAWRDHLHEAGLLARAAAIQVARVHLAAGHDVVIPQYVGRLEFIEQLEQLAADVNASFVEIVLIDSKENAIERFEQRTAAAADRAHVDAYEALDQGNPRQQLAQMYDQLLAVADARPDAKTVATEAGNPAGAYELMLRHLS